jgi:hypothetical protein
VSERVEPLQRIRGESGLLAFGVDFDNTVAMGIIDQIGIAAVVDSYRGQIGL